MNATEIELWLAREVVDCTALLSIATGDTAGARSRITSSALDRSGSGIRVQVQGPNVDYQCPGVDPYRGSVKVRRLVDVAATLLTPDKVERLSAAKRAYTDECIAGREVVYSPGMAAGDFTRWQEHQQRYREVSDRLRAATFAWWVTDDVAEPEQLSLFAEAAA